jgi:hypothetical protein
MANVGVFRSDRQPPLVPDALLSVDVDLGEDLLARENRSYFIWRMGHPPDVVIEIVSDRRGGEDGVKMRGYARIRVFFYVIFDPENQLEGGVLRAYRLQDDLQYHPIDPGWLPAVGLGLTLWNDVFEGHRQQWLRWCDRDGRVIPTGAERADEERRRADEERRRADEERRRADEERARRERLAAQLRALGVEPEV